MLDIFVQPKHRFAVGLAFVAAGVLLMFITLRPVFSGDVVLQQSFRIGPLTLHYYGMILAIAVAAARWLALRRAPRYGLTAHQADKIIFISIIAGFLGARLYHVASEIQFYFANPHLVFAIWRGGLSIFGALLGGALALAIMAWREQRAWSWAKFNHLLNWLTFSFLGGQIIGRFGNFYNYEAYGTPTELAWKMFVPAQFRPRPWVLEMYFHPWFLYEVLANALIFIVLWRWKRFSPTLFLWYLLLYNIVRFLLEFLRIDSVFIGPLRLNVVASAVLAALAVGLLFKLKNQSHNSAVPQNN